MGGFGAFAVCVGGGDKILELKRIGISFGIPDD